MSKISAILTRKVQPALEAEPVVESFDESALESDDELLDAEVAESIDTALEPVNEELEENAPDFTEGITEQTNRYQEVANVIDNSMQEGGLSLEAAQILNIFANHDGHPRVRARVSTESFGTAALYESRVALEAVMDVVRDWWKRLTDFLKSARSRFMQWIQNAFNGAQGLIDQGNALKERAAGATPGTGDIKFEKKAALEINGTFPDIGVELGRFADLADGVLVQLLDSTYQTNSELADAVAGFQYSDEGAVGSLVTKLAQVISQPADAISGQLTENVDDSVTQVLLKGAEGVQVQVKASKPYLGNAQLSAVIVNITPTGGAIENLSLLAKATKLSRVELLDVSEEGKIWSPRAKSTENGEAPTVARAAPGDVSQIADAAIKVGNAMLKVKGTAGHKTAMDRNVDRAGQAISNMNLDEGQEGAASVASSLRTIVSSTASYPSQVSSRLISWFGSVTKVAIAYGNASLAGNVAETEGDNQPQQPAQA